MVVCGQCGMLRLARSALIAPQAKPRQGGNAHVFPTVTGWAALHPTVYRILVITTGRCINYVCTCPPMINLHIFVRVANSKPFYNNVCYDWAVSYFGWGKCSNTSYVVRSITSPTMNTAANTQNSVLYVAQSGLRATSRVTVQPASTRLTCIRNVYKRKTLLLSLTLKQAMRNAFRCTQNPSLHEHQLRNRHQVL